MSSQYWLLSGLGCIAASFGVQSLAAPLLSGGVVCGIVAEQKRRFEVQYAIPLQRMRYATWIDQEEQAIGYGALQADYALQIQHDQAMGVNSALLLTTLEAKAREQKPSSPEQPAKTDKAEVEVVEDPWMDSETPLLDLKSLTNATLLLIWGVSGSGKTTLAKRIGLLRQQSGHRVQVADPHGSLPRWQPFDVIGSGKNYPRLERFLDEFQQQIKDDYGLYEQGEPNFPWQTLIVDEFTGWADQVRGSREFVLSSCSDLRKINRCVVLVTHADTLAGLGGAAGLREAIDRSAIKLELEAEISREDGQYAPTGYGWLQYPGSPKQRVRIPR